MDLVERQKVVDALLGITAMRNTIPLDSAIFNIKKLPSAQPEVLACGEGKLSAQPEQQWIPCSERLPESGRYLVSCSLSVFSPQVLNYDENNGEWFYDGCKSMDVEIPTINAWMPLPEPYKGE